MVRIWIESLQIAGGNEGIGVFPKGKAL